MPTPLISIVLLLLLSWLPVAAWPQVAWLTVVGDPSDAALDTVQVDPVPVEAGEVVKTLRVRVSRATQRTSWDGIGYRSYESTVLFDCERKTALYQSITYFSRPVWAGTPVRTVGYTQGTPRPMAFRDVRPNPNQRLINAACGSAR